MKSLKVIFESVQPPFYKNKQMNFYKNGWVVKYNIIVGHLILEIFKIMKVCKIKSRK